MTRSGGAGLRDPATLLASWDAGADAPALARGAAVVQAAGLCAEDTALDLPLGELAGLAARCLAESFGGPLDCVLRCPACDRPLELEFPVELVAHPDPNDPPAMHAARAELGSRQVTVRSPSTHDLVEASGRADPRADLVRRCVSGPLDPDRLSAEDWRSLEDGFERVSAAALPALRTSCPECAADVEGVVDVCALLWDRVDLAAPALLRDVAELAASFGWSEREILAMSGRRRSAYLELVRG